MNNLLTGVGGTDPRSRKRQTLSAACGFAGRLNHIAIVTVFTSV